LTGRLGPRGQLQPVAGLSGKTQAALHGRIRALVAPHGNAAALRELVAGSQAQTPLRLRTSPDLLSVLALEPPASGGTEGLPVPSGLGRWGVALLMAGAAALLAPTRPPAEALSPQAPALASRLVLYPVPVA